MKNFHHIVNRSNIFRNSKDKDKFLEILCKASKDYKVNIHTLYYSIPKIEVLGLYISYHK